jgi:hypothetical protein
MRRNQMMPMARQFGPERTYSAIPHDSPTADDMPRFFLSMPDLHSPGGLEDLPPSTVHDEILVTSGEPAGGC